MPNCLIWNGDSFHYLFILSVSLSVRLYGGLSTGLSVCLSVSLSVHLSFHLSVCLSVHPSVSLSTCLSIYLLINPSVYYVGSMLLIFLLYFGRLFENIYMSVLVPNWCCVTPSLPIMAISQQWFLTTVPKEASVKRIDWSI